MFNYFNIDKYFDYICGVDFEEIRVKKGDVIRYVLEEVKIIDLLKVIMVGDWEYDIIGVKENNLKFVGVLYGYGDVIELI